MKPRYLFTVIGLLCLLHTSHAQQVRFYYPDSTLSSEGTLREGKPDGFWKTYYPEGTLKSAGNRKNFLLDSVWYFFYQNADTAESIEYRAAKKNGYYLKYQQSTPSLKNIVVAKELWLNDKRNGPAFYFHSNGILQMEVRFDDGLKQGDAKVYDETGRLVAINLYKNDFLVYSERINRTDIAGLKQGIWRDFYPNGKIKTEYNYKNNRLNGYLKTFDEMGKLVATERYEDGELVIEKIDNTRPITNKKENYATGELRFMRTLQGDKPVGIQREFDKEGKVIDSEVFNNDGRLVAKGVVEMNGRRNGAWINYNPDSTLRSSGNYVNGLQSGPWKFYYPNGKIEQLGVYNAGKFSSQWQWFYPNGNLWKEESYENGLLNGTYIEYDPNSNVIAKGNYLDGERTGIWRTQSGDQIEEGPYNLDFRDGTWKFYYPDGTLKFEGDFLGDSRTGTHHYYHANGKLKEVRNYRDNKEHGKWLQYDETGLLVLTLEYNKGELKRIDGINVDN